MNEDIEEFLEKVNYVEDEMKKIMTDPNSVGKEEENDDKEHFERLRKERIAKELREEREKWWEKAKIYREGLDNFKKEVEKGKIKVCRSNTLNYSIWEQWLKKPDDPVSTEEYDEIERKKQDIENDEFEKANPAFCQMVREDINSRKKNENKKELDINKIKNKGNSYFKLGDYNKAIEYYKEGMLINNLEISLLSNIMISYFKLDNIDECHDYVKRVLFLDDQNIKANYYQGLILFNMSNYDEAIIYFSKTNKNNNDANVYFERCRLEITRIKEEKLINDTNTSDLQSLLAIDDQKRNYAFIVELLGANNIDRHYIRVQGFLDKIKDEILAGIRNISHSTLSNYVNVIANSLLTEYNYFYLSQTNLFHVILENHPDHIDVKKSLYNFLSKCLKYPSFSGFLNKVNLYNLLLNGFNIHNYYVWENILDSFLTIIDNNYYKDMIYKSNIFNDLILKIDESKDVHQVMTMLEPGAIKKLTNEILILKIYDILIKLSLISSFQSQLSDINLFQVIERQIINPGFRSHALGILSNCMTSPTVIDLFISNHGIERCIDLLKSDKRTETISRCFYCLNKTNMRDPNLLNIKEYVLFFLYHISDDVSQSSVVQIIASMSDKEPTKSVIRANLKVVIDVIHTLSSNSQPNFKIVGNICKILLPLFPDDKIFKEIDKTTIVEDLVTLIRIIKNEISRNNIAILLSKLSKYPPFIQKIRDLDAMRILLDLARDIQ